MIPSGAVVFVATKPVDFRKGPESLMALVREGGADPFSGALFVFRAKRADRVKIVWWDGTGLCLFAKRLDERLVGAAPGARGGHGLDTGEGGSRTTACLGRLTCGAVTQGAFGTSATLRGVIHSRE